MKNSVCLPREKFKGSTYPLKNLVCLSRERIQRYTIITCLKDCIRKIDKGGKAIYLLCRKLDPMKYGTNLRATLRRHVQSFGHVQREVEKLTSYIPSGKLIKVKKLSAYCVERLIQ